MNKLVQELEDANKAYREGNPYLSDKEYDLLIEQLKSIDPNHPYLNKVEEEIFTLPKVKHSKPMLSMQKAYTKDDLQKFFSSIEKQYGQLHYDFMPKLDGMSAVFENDILATRGDGIEGFDITYAFERGLKVWGDNLNPDKTYHGEIVLLQEYFDTHLSDKYKHPRNVVVGAIKSDDPGEDQIKAFNDGAIYFVPFSKLPTTIQTSEFILNNLDWAQNVKDVCPFPIDGFVIEIRNKYNNIKEQLGYTSHHYRYNIAYKPQKEEDIKTAYVKDIHWQVGKNGQIVPVLEIEPTELSGAVVTKVTAHNYGFIRDNNISIQSKVKVIRSGEVIPKVLEMIEPSEYPIPYKQICPVCSEQTVLVNDIMIKCNNTDCYSQKVGKLEHFFKTLNILGFGRKTCEVFVDQGFTYIPDILSMTEEQFNLVIGGKTAKNLRDSIQKSRGIKYPDWKILASVGIPSLGKGDSKKLLEIYDIWELLDKVSVNDIKSVKGFGDKTSEIIYRGTQEQKEVLNFLIRFFDFDITCKSEVNYMENSFVTGKNIVITGTLTNSDMTRKQMQEYLKTLGANPQDSLNKSTDILVTGEKVGKNKIDKAAKYGTEIITEEQFIRMV